ncbi:MAG TPA: hypothetical protein DCY91_00510 [Cyanobacteria bacterium UBA11370]|nr:hypothetical protein [Cyanobacteria bacterium UBA11370]HBY81570.1 hypothetical protein [Cyanobacteria bacterium UBA11148]
MSNQIAIEIQNLEKDLAILKRTNLSQIEGKVDRLLKLLDEPNETIKQSDRSLLKQQLITILATAILSLGIAKTPDILPLFNQPPRTEQLQPPSRSTSAKPHLNAQLDALAIALISQESGGNHQIVNADSGAMGLFQIMPSNLKSWSTAALGYEVSREQFLASGELQIQIAKHRLNEYLNLEKTPQRSEEEIIRRVASLWYSGRAHLWNNTKPQYSNRRQYPSIAEYTLSVWQKYRLKKNSPDVINKKVIYSWATQWQQDPKTGDKIAGYVVTSPRGWRYHPITKVQSFHHGVDIATPTGTSLYAIASGTVSCWNDSGGGGKVASFKSETFPGLQFDLLHLSECVVAPGQTKSVNAGEAIGFTGNSGASTGAHLDLRIKDLATGKRLRVRAGWLHWFLTGVKP